MMAEISIYRLCTFRGSLRVHPDHERQGFGRLLHDEMLSWLWSQGLEKLWLTTEPGTRAEQFYKAAGWDVKGNTDSGEVCFEKHR